MVSDGSGWRQDVANQCLQFALIGVLVHIDLLPLVPTNISFLLSSLTATAWSNTAWLGASSKMNISFLLSSLTATACSNTAWLGASSETKLVANSDKLDRHARFLKPARFQLGLPPPPVTSGSHKLNETRPVFPRVV